MAASCDALAELPCVFIIALGRTGSTHLLRLLNEIPGYRLSGETDNAWVYLGWWREQLLATAAAASALGRRRRLQAFEMPASWELATKRRRQKRSRSGGSGGSGGGVAKAGHSAMAAAAAVEQRRAAGLCAMRELMLLLHNPPPRAATFGFKEIYSPFVREPAAFGEVFSQGVKLIRELFPRAKFIFHSRRNLTRTAESWLREFRDGNRTERLAHFDHVNRRYVEYAARNPGHAFATTLEGLTDRHNMSEVEALFRFLGTPLSSRLRRVVRSPVKLHDWVEEKHMRRAIERRDAARRREARASAAGHPARHDVSQRHKLPEST